MIELGKIGEIIISQELQHSIDYHHKLFGSVEWSGMLFYRHTKGSFKDLKDLEFVAEQFYLMDKGTGATTDHKFEGEDVTKAYKAIPEAIEYLTGEIHTHHTMQAFFSGTDITDLRTNASTYGFYISLVVNIKGDYVCKVAIPIESQSVTMIDTEGNKTEISSLAIANTLVGDLDVVLPEDSLKVPKWIVDRAVEVDSKPVVKKTFTPTYQGYGKSTMGFDYGRSINGEYLGTKSTFLTEAEEFVISLLTLGDTGVSSIKKAVESLSVYKTTAELSEYIAFVKLEADILHYNVYSTDFGLEMHMQSALSTLENYKPMNWRLKQFVEELKVCDYV